MYIDIIFAHAHKEICWGTTRFILVNLKLTINAQI